MDGVWVEVVAFEMGSGDNFGDGTSHVGERCEVALEVTRGGRSAGADG